MASLPFLTAPRIYLQIIPLCAPARRGVSFEPHRLCARQLQCQLMPRRIGDLKITPMTCGGSCSRFRKAKKSFAPISIWGFNLRSECQKMPLVGECRVQYLAVSDTNPTHVCK